MNKVAAAIIAGSIAAAWTSVAGYYWYMWFTGAIRLRRRLLAEGNSGGTLPLSWLYAHARKEEPRSPEAARLLRGLRGMLLTAVVLVGLMVAIVLAVSSTT